MGFLISRKARDKYKFDQSLFKPSGNVAFKNFKAVQKFAAELENIKARAGEINAIDLIHETFHYVLQLYIKQKNPQMLKKAGERLQKELSGETLDAALRLFAQEFPSTGVYRGKYPVERYLEGASRGRSHRQLLLKEMLLLWITNVNPACKPYKKELFDDAGLKKKSAYQKIIMELERFFTSQPLFGPGHQNLVAMLRSPAIAVPDSLSGQLAYIREHWGELLGDFLSRLLSGLDLLKEEEKFRGLGPGESLVYDFSRKPFDEEYERFSADHDWMPRLVLMAKSTHVWLDQLSKKYHRHISRLDQIPDEELDELSRRGFTGLWLIGVWERSQASQRIKQMCGNPEALASAYSIYEYRVAHELGGEEALNNLKHRAWQRGIRLGSDMVPNHMGIDSPWLVEHPEWFLSLDYCPYPSYSFNGPDLSADDRVSIFLEDHYYDRTDAAVVFKWVNNNNGEVRYIYHGNDGTSMPWNDTAQLNYLNPEVREAVTRAIFSVAAKFSIIRFDAAMTLTKRHYQRLWFPEPGSGGDIPTRAWHGMNQTEFYHHMPEEFWRQVVDRFAAAHSDTLLLAEAFWLMEAYFVRTLGMHRVYNSAFMNFLKNEDNAKFRTSIKNILQFNPEILKRFVNFMNNPDEETAVVQFGKGDKYFGVCTLMVTLPGLPMFGHGQVEGFAEKYGMEYRRAYWDETPDEHLVLRHEREIFPLMRKRYLFADVGQFLFYDFFTPAGWVNEDVVAYSNHFGQECCLVVYHNKFAETFGWIKTSVSFLNKNSEGDHLVQNNLGQGLKLTPGENYYTIFRQHTTGLEYIRSSQELFEKGLYVELKAYETNVFLDFRQVEDDDRRVYAQLAAMLRGKGVPSIDDTLRKYFFNPLLEPFRELVNFDLFQRLKAAAADTKPNHLQSITDLLAEIEERLYVFLKAVQEATTGSSETGPSQIARRLRRKLEGFVTLQTRDIDIQEVLRWIAEEVHELDFAWFFLHPLGKVMKDADADQVWELLEDWRLVEEITALLTAVGYSPERVPQLLDLLKLMMRWQEWWKWVEKDKEKQWIDRFFQDADVMKVLKVNRHKHTLWFHQESGEELISRLFFMAMFGLSSSTWDSDREVEHYLGMFFRLIQGMKLSLHQSAYRWETFIKRLKETLP
ncbi:MAG: alpha-amylase family glycosyl hydrolase [Candidatus Aminicenantes bacterium]